MSGVVQAAAVLCPPAFNALPVPATPGGQQTREPGSSSLSGRSPGTHPKCCTPIMGAATATRSSTAAVSQVCMPPRLTPVMPMRAASTSGLHINGSMEQQSDGQTGLGEPSNTDSSEAVNKAEVSYQRRAATQNNEGAGRQH